MQGFLPNQHSDDTCRDFSRRDVVFDECVKNNLIDPKDIHNQENFYFGNKDPFIKPYALEKQDLIDFRQKIYSELNMTNYLVKQIA